MTTPTPWTRSHPPGLHRDGELWPRAGDRFSDGAVAAWPEHPPIDFTGRLFSCREFGDLVARAATGLQQIGVEPGMCGGWHLANTSHGLTGFFAAPKAVGVVVDHASHDTEQVLEHKVDGSQTDEARDDQHLALASILANHGRYQRRDVGAMELPAELPKAPVGKLSKEGRLEQAAARRATRSS